MRRTNKLILAFVAVLASLALIGPQAASAHESSFGSDVTISRGRGLFSGRVRAGGGCDAGRSVTLKKVRSGADLVVGRDTTSGSGGWAVGVRRASGRYYATVSRDVSGGYRHTHTCFGGSSGSIRV